MKLSDEEKIKTILNIPRNAIDLVSAGSEENNDSIFVVTLGFRVDNLEKNRVELIDYLFER